MKVLWILVLVTVAFRLFAGRWPWELIRPYRTRREAVMRARRLLGVDARASRQEIQDAHRQLVAAVHPDRAELTTRCMKRTRRATCCSKN